MKQLLMASRGHQAPRKAAHCLRKEVGQNIKGLNNLEAEQRITILQIQYILLELDMGIQMQCSLMYVTD